MSSSQRGTGTSPVEVTQISGHGVWVLAHGEELFMPYEEFPWFKDATVGAVLRVEEAAPGHLYWPDLDVDLGVDMIRDPSRFPLRAK